MDLLVSGWNLKQFSIVVSPSPPLVPPASSFPSTITCGCSFYKSRGSAHKVSYSFRTYSSARISNKSSPPLVIHSRKKNTKSEPPLEPTIVEEVSVDEEDEQFLFDDFEDDESMMDDDDDFFEEEYAENDTELYVSSTTRVTCKNSCVCQSKLARFGKIWVNIFEEEYAENDTELYAGDGAGGGGISLAGTWWDKEALLLAGDVCQSFGGDLGIYAFKTLSNSSIQVRVERLTNKSGSPSMEDIEAFSVSYRAKLDEAELARSVAENITLEVSSPGVERVVRIPEDLDRFKDRSLYVKYVMEIANTGKLSEADGVFRLVSFDMETKCFTWGLADVRINREKAGKGRPLSKKQREWRLETTFDSLRLVRLYSEA